MFDGSIFFFSRFLSHVSKQAGEYLCIAFNPLSVNPVKWLNTLKQFVENIRRTVLVYLTILWSWRLKI